MRTLRFFYDQIAAAAAPFRHSFEEFANAYFVVCSRVFGIGQGCLVPYADMANAAPESECNAKWAAEAGTFRLIACSPIKKGEEIRISYGHKSNLDYFAHYGFTLPGVEYDAAGFLLPYENVKNGELKKRLMHHEISGANLAKFYRDGETRAKQNRRFMSFCRFYWSEEPAEFLCSVLLGFFTRR